MDGAPNGPVWKTSATERHCPMRRIINALSVMLAASISCKNLVVLSILVAMLATAIGFTGTALADDGTNDNKPTPIAQGTDRVIQDTDIARDEAGAVRFLKAFNNFADRAPITEAQRVVNGMKDTRQAPIAKVALHWSRVTEIEVDLVHGWSPNARVKTGVLGTSDQRFRPDDQRFGAMRVIKVEFGTTPEDILEDVYYSGGHFVEPTREKALRSANNMANMGYHLGVVDLPDDIEWTWVKSGEPVNHDTVSDNVSFAEYGATHIHAYRVVVHADICVAATRVTGVTENLLLAVSNRAVGFAKEGGIYNLAFQAINDLGSIDTLGYYYQELGACDPVAEIASGG